MGLWSSIKKRAKQAWRAVKAVVRVVLKAVVGLVRRIINVIGEILTFGLVEKKFRIQCFVLRDELGGELIADSDLQMPIGNAKKIFKSEFNIALLSYGKPDVQVLPDPAPKAALDVRCDGGAFKDEFGEAGEYFAGWVAGWNGIPISLKFPVTVFVVRSIVGKVGCSIPIVDYVTLAATAPNAPPEVTGVTSTTTLAHELAHTCLLLDRNQPLNLLHLSEPRGTSTTWWQRRMVRTSRHCTFT